jgi:hypothetical protein
MFGFINQRNPLVITLMASGRFDLVDRSLGIGWRRILCAATSDHCGANLIRRHSCRRQSLQERHFIFKQFAVIAHTQFAFFPSCLTERPAEYQLWFAENCGKRFAEIRDVSRKESPPSFLHR